MTAFCQHAMHARPNHLARILTCRAAEDGRASPPHFDRTQRWDGWDGLGRLWDGCKSENHPCLPALGRWDGCTPPSHSPSPLPRRGAGPACLRLRLTAAPGIYTYLHPSTPEYGCLHHSARKAVGDEDDCRSLPAAASVDVGLFRGHFFQVSDDIRDAFVRKSFRFQTPAFHCPPTSGWPWDCGCTGAEPTP